MEVECIDRISELPDFVLHRVLSRLRIKDAARTSVLSKRWKHIFETFPNFKFSHHDYVDVPLIVSEITPECTRLVGDFLDAVGRSLSRSLLCGLRGYRFSIRTTVVDPKLTSKLDECFELALKTCASEINIFLFPTWLPRGVDDVVLPETVFVSNPLGYRSLRVLSLWHICLSDKTINDIFLSCPNISSLVLLSVTGIRKLDICKLDRLEEVHISSVKHLSVDIVDAPKLRRFCFTGYMQDTKCKLNLTSCRGLRVLDLEGIGIADELFRSLITACPLLKDLAISTCKTPRKVEISAKDLTSLVFYKCREIRSLEIDAPALASFKHHSKALPRLLLKTVPSQLEIVHELTDWNIPINTSHFVRLREFLALSTLTDRFRVIVDSGEVLFDLEELRQAVVPRAFQLQRLEIEVEYVSQCSDEQALIDGLLWSCHPKTISVFLRDKIMHHSCIEVLRKSVLEMEKNPTCCGTSDLVKCWRHDLKSATAEIFEGRDEKKPVICFELEWCDSIW